MYGGSLERDGSIYNKEAHELQIYNVPVGSSANCCDKISSLLLSKFISTSGKKVYEWNSPS